MNLHIRTIGELLQSAGIGPSARVGIVLPQGPEAALFGISIAACATSVPLNPALNPTELDDDFRRLDLDAVVLPAWQQSTAWEVAQRTGLQFLKRPKLGLIFRALHCELFALLCARIQISSFSFYYWEAALLC
jgi:acyl-CoA synthetase (AMP-forming)/AMP-acid ligase II